MSIKKRERRKAAQLEAAKRLGKRVLTLSIAMLRADALFEKFEEEMRVLAAQPQNEDEHRSEAVAATKRMENTIFSRTDSLFSVQLGTLYAVIEKWREWKLSDPVVDRLLQSPNVELLKKYRHAIFHADYYDHQSLKRFAEKKDILPWLAELAVAIRDYLRRWHSDPARYVEEYLNRVGG